MSEKALRIVLGVVAALLVVYAVTAVASRGPGAGAVDGGALADALAAAWTDDVEAVRIAGAGDTVALDRTASGWVVDGYPADSARVAAFREAITGATVAHLAAANPANHARLGVSEDSARVVELRRSGGAATRLLIGDRGPSYQSVYVRLPDRDEVYLVRGDLRAPAQRTADEWRDRTIARVDTAAVQRITVTRGDDAYTLARAEDGWTVDDAPADATAVRDLLGELASLDATGFAPDTVTIDEPSRTVLAFGAHGDTLAHITLGETDGSNLLVRVPDKSATFELTSWRANRLAPPAEDVEADASSSGE